MCSRAKQGGGSLHPLHLPCSTDEQRPLGTKLHSEKREGYPNTSGIIYREVDIPFRWQMKVELLLRSLVGKHPEQIIPKYFLPQHIWEIQLHLLKSRETNSPQGQTMGREGPTEEEEMYFMPQPWPFMSQYWDMNGLFVWPKRSCHPLLCP